MTRKTKSTHLNSLYDRKKLSSLFKEYQKRTGQRQSTIAYQLGIGRCYFNGFYHGKSPLRPSPALIDRMAELLGIDRYALYVVCNQIPREVRNEFIKSYENRVKS